MTRQEFEKAIAKTKPGSKAEQAVYDRLLADLLAARAARTKRVRVKRKREIDEDRLGFGVERENETRRD